MKYATRFMDSKRDSARGRSENSNALLLGGRGIVNMCAFKSLLYMDLCRCFVWVLCGVLVY